MFISGSILKNTMEKYKRHLRKKRREHFDSEEVGKGAGDAFSTFTLIFAFILFIMELILLFYAINMALVCTQKGPERVVNIILAITFTAPYVMLNILFNACAKDSLKTKAPWH